MYIPLRNHTSYSLCSGAIKIDTLVDFAKTQQLPAIGICDSQNLFGALEFSLACKKSGIQSIVGCELLVDFHLLEAKNNNHLDFEKSLAITPLFAFNQQGYENLMSLVSYSFLHRKSTTSPFIALELLKKHSEGLIALSGGLEGAVAKLLLNNQKQLAKQVISEMLTMFSENNFYLEITRYQHKDEQKIEPEIVQLAIDHNIPLVATNNAFFATPNMHEAQDILSCIATGSSLEEEGRAKNTAWQYLRDSQEFCQLFSDLPEALENTINIAKKCHVMPTERSPALPSFSSEPSFDEYHEITKQAKLGLLSRLQQKFLESQYTTQQQQEITLQYQQRLDYELEIIIKMNFAGYFLIVSDFIKWAKQQQIPVGPGRGSGAGCLVAWALQITDPDPIRFGLLFERFLNPERVSMPDFDIDFCQSRRDEVISYVQQKYGFEYVAQIITFGKLQARAVLKDVGRVLQMPYSQVDRICKLIPFNAIEAVTLQKAIDMDKDLQQAILDDNQISRLVDIGLKLEGLNRHASTHAAGIVIGDKPLQKICALYQDFDSTMPAVGYSMKYAESAGLVKFDFLGLKTLTVIADTVKLVAQTRKINIDINTISLNDKNTFDMLAIGDSIGVFQIESSGMRSVLKQMKADKLEDIVALISLYRPGPIDNIPTYIKRKHGEEQIQYPHPMLQEVLQETYGVIVYQEQVMEIAKILAGYSLGAADLLRRAMGKKIKEEMDKQREIFIAGANKNNINTQQASEIFDLVDKFAGYGFNKSHAVAYALISYQTAYLKANFLPEFLTASINLELDNTDKINIYLQVAKTHNIPILPPSINNSQAYFSIECI